MASGSASQPGRKMLSGPQLALEEALMRRVLIDTLDGRTHRAHGAAWNPVYVIGRN